MNKKVEKKSVKSNKVIRNFILFCIVAFLLGVLLSIKYHEINIIDNSKFNKFTSIDGNLVYYVNLNENATLYENNIDININIENFNEDFQYQIYINVDGKNIINEIANNNSNHYNIPLDSEGEKEINVIIYVNNIEKSNETIKIYYVEQYQKQFLDELSKKGIGVHYRDGSWEIYENSNKLLKSLGIKYIRTDFLWSSIEKNDDKFDFSEYDVWVNDLTENNIKIIAIVNGLNTNNSGSNLLIDTDKEIEEYVKFLQEIINHYPQIDNYEIMNEVNVIASSRGGYLTKEDVSWYSKLIKKINELIEDKNKTYITAGTVTLDETDSRITSERFFTYLYNTNGFNYTNHFAYHPYAWNYLTTLQTKISSHKELFNSFGGFSRLDVTEYGSSIYYGTEDVQASELVKETVILEESSNLIILYNLWSTATTGLEQYGILSNDYTPRPAYYAMKNYYENTNGAEYIGTVNLADGLEAHVYDKDGKPKIIAWSTNTENSIELPYENFTASDIYGNEIENTNGTLEITTSPVYLDNISDAYFYEAISNTALEKYAEFEKKFEAEIANINGLQEEINTLKQYMSSIANNTTEDENVAIEQMNTHFNLGNVILSAYKNRSLDVEYVKLSSMLDMLNDIGNSYEDLLTVCATTRAPYYTATEELINSAENKINNNSDLEIVYPSKILDFAKELDEKSEYINSLSEENDIKTGLIVSNSLHAYYLADWANEFASIYIDEYIEANPVTISYTNSTDWTNEDVVVTLNIDNDATVTNNGGSNTYTFRSNGSFTFEYERRGQAFTLEAKVSNIDKTYPTITGVEDGQTYTSSVKPVIEDTNLSIVSISYNGEDIEYYDGIILEDEGMYSIVATDRAGNTTTVEFNIISNVQDEYVLQGNYLLNVWQETTLADFKNNYTSQEESYIIKRNDTELTDTDIIATGDIIELSSGDTYTIVVAGDINCDGRVTVFDLSALRRYILKQIEFTEIELLSADINIDGNNIGAKDYSRMRLEILGMH